MASGDKSVGELTPASVITEEDLFVLEQNGEPKRLEAVTLIAYLLQKIDGHGGITGIAKQSSAGLVDTYKITFADSSTSSFTVTNGEKGEKGDPAYVWIKYASQKPTEESHAMGDAPDAWIGIYSGFDDTAPTSWSVYTWYKFKGDQGPVGATPQLQIGSVTSVDHDEPANASFSGTPENPVLNLRIPRGRNGLDGEYASDWAENNAENPGFVKNRTHYIKSAGGYVLITEVTFSVDTVWLSYDSETQITYNVDYDIILDGHNYVCRSRDIIAIMGKHTIALGNLHLLSEAYEDTGEPFVFYITDGATTGYLVAPGYEGKTVVVEIWTAAVIQKLDNIYLDAEWMATRRRSGLTGPVVAARSLAFTSNILLVQDFPAYGLEEGAVYTVSWNGTAYTCQCFAKNNTWYLGNGELGNIVGGGSEPFLIESYGGTSVFVYKDTETAETITLKIDGQGSDDYEQIPREFLPDVYPYIKLTSPDGSVFKITVSNSGTLTAEKIT